MRIIEDLPYYTSSGGGLTLSGGEPLAQLPELLPLLKRCKDEAVHTVMQTNLSLPFEESVPYVDHYLVDLKTMDNEKHKAWIGGDTAAVLNNLQKLDQIGSSYEVRTPVIPYFNDTEEAILSLAAFVKTLKNCKRYRLLGYHSLALPKYTQFGISLAYDISQGLDSSVLSRLQDLIEREIYR
jgi:pyruvate formate lyase activating enzyme